MTVKGEGKRIWKWIRGSLIAMAVLIAIVTIVVYKLGNRIAQHYLRGILISQIEERTGARVEMRYFFLHGVRLRAEIYDLTLHGNEPPGAPPLFHADHIDVGLKVISFFARDWRLDHLLVQHPQLNVQVNKSGGNNIPTPRVPPSNKPWQDSLFGLRVGLLDLQQGAVTFNNQKTLFNAKGQNFHFHLAYDHPVTGADAYVGDFEWYQIEIAAKGDAPFRFDTSGKFLLHHDSFELTDFNLKLPHSDINLRAEMSSFTRPTYDLHYRGKLSLEDVRTIVKAPLVPDALTDFSGTARLAPGGEWSGSGHYSAHDIKLPYEWFHATGLSSWGDYQITKQQLVIPNFNVAALEGRLDGRVEMDMKTLAFKTNTHFSGASLADAFDAVNNINFPLDTLKWEGAIDVVSENTWVAAFQHFRTRGDSRWTPPTVLDPKHVPVTAEVHFDYIDDKRAITLTNSQITTPHTQIEFNGFLGAKDSTLNLNLNASDVHDWAGFVNYLIDPDAQPVPLSGALQFDGRLLGPIAGPTFAGHAHATDAHYDTYFFDELEGDIDYSVDAIRFANATVKRGEAVAKLDLNLGFDHAWSFTADSPISVEGTVDKAPSADVQLILGTKYPVTATVSGTFRGGGTRSQPTFDANVQLAGIEAKGYKLDSASGLIHYSNDEVRLSRAEILRHQGRVTGNLTCRPTEKTIEFTASGVGLPIEEMQAIQTKNVPFGGTVDFNVRGSGPISAPTGEGDIHVVSLQVGTEDQGDFIGHVTSDGTEAHVDITSEKSNGNLSGQINLSFKGDQEITGKLSMKQFDLDPLLKSGLHLKNLTKHSVVDGDFTLTGQLKKPDTIEVDAKISYISFDYSFVSLKNDGPLEFAYRRNEVRVTQARITGTNSNFEITGSARFDRDRPVHVNVTGAVNLALLKGLIPDLTATGQADANVAVQGTLSKPRITGRASLQDASAIYEGSPVGLSHVKGDIVFDSSRMLFENMTADSGGGTLTLGGSVTYGEEGPVRYEITATTQQVRVRYPAGMSWLVGGSLQLSGTADAAILSGNVELKRLLFAPGVDISSFFAPGPESGGGLGSGSAFMRNLTFDVASHTAPGARIEWVGAQVEIDSDLHLRGTPDHPILLGHIHLLGGEMSFRGNNFALTRGDINFANPFQLDPELNIEATSTISQYQVTINFSGRASKLSLSYRSDPPLPDTDIIALLALGSTGEESALRSGSGSGGQNYGATALLSEAISSGLGGRIEHLFGISHFRVDPFLAGTTTESSASARVTIEQQVTRDLTITYSSNAASDQEQLIQVEYHVKRDLSVVFLRDINGTYSLDVKFVRHFH
jgi:translocation and assembly module TamB